MLRRGSMIFTGTEKELAEFDENVRRMTQESLGFNDAEMAWYESLPEDQSGAFSRRRALERVNSPRWTAPRFLAAPERFERKTNAEKEKFIQWRDEHLDHSGDISDLYHRAGYSSWRAQEAESFEGLADEWRVELADFERYRAFILGIRGFVERNPESYHQETYRLFADAEDPEAVNELINECRWAHYPVYIDTTAIRVSDEVIEHVLDRLQDDVASLVRAIGEEVVAPNGKETAKEVQDWLEALCKRISAGEIESESTLFGNSIWDALSDVRRRVEDVFGPGRWAIDCVLMPIRSENALNAEFHSALREWDAAVLFKPPTAYIPMSRESRREGVDDLIQTLWDYLSTRWLQAPILSNSLLTALLRRYANQLQTNIRAAQMYAWQERAITGVVGGVVVIAYRAGKGLLTLGAALALFFSGWTVASAIVVLAALSWKAIKYRDRTRLVIQCKEPLRVVQGCISEIEEGKYMSEELKRRVRNIETQVKIDTAVYGLLDLRHGEPAQSS